MASSAVSAICRAAAGMAFVLCTAACVVSERTVKLAASEGDGGATTGQPPPTGETKASVVDAGHPHNAASDSDSGERNAPAGMSATSQKDGGQVGAEVARAGGPSSGSGGSAAGGSNGACHDATCACSKDDDCEQRGIAGGVCANSMCLAPAAQCAIDADCLARGPEFAGGRCVRAECWPNPRWRCEAAAPPAPDKTEELNVKVVDWLSSAAIPNARVVACSKLDLTCVMPLASATTGADGMLKVIVPAGFDGFLQQTELRNYLPAMYFLQPRRSADDVLGPFPLLASGAASDALAAALGTSLDGVRGHLLLTLNDCFDMALQGVKFTSPQADAKAVQFYVQDQLPSTTVMESTKEGAGGYVNFPVGTAVIHSAVAKSGLDLGTVSLVVRSGFVTVARIQPPAR